MHSVLPTSVRSFLGPIAENPGRSLHAYNYSKARRYTKVLDDAEGVSAEHRYMNMRKSHHQSQNHEYDEYIIMPKRTMARPTAFDRLPHELQQNIVAYLDPSSLVSFRQTCQRYYHSIPLLTHLHEIEMLDKHRDNYACALCQSIKPETAFALRRTFCPFSQSHDMQHNFVALPGICMSNSTIQRSQEIKRRANLSGVTASVKPAV